MLLRRSLCESVLFPVGEHHYKEGKHESRSIDDSNLKQKNPFVLEGVKRKKIFCRVSRQVGDILSSSCNTGCLDTTTEDHVPGPIGLRVVSKQPVLPELE